MSENRGLIKNIASLGIVQIANYVFPLISIPIISRIIGPEKFGIINYSAAFIGYFTLMINYGFDLSATRKLSKDPHNIQLRNDLFSQVLSAKFLLFLLSAIIFCFCLYFIPPLKQNITVALFSFSICLSTVLTQNWFFQSMQDLPKVAIINFVGKLFFTVTILLVIKKEEDYLWQPLILSVVQLCVTIFALVWMVKKYKIKFRITPMNEVLNIIWSERMIFFSLVVISLYTTTNTVVLGILQNPQQVGFYTAAQRLMDVASNVVNQPLAQSMYPFIGAAFGISHNHGIQTVQKTLPLIILFTGILAVGMYTLGPVVLVLFYGDSFAPSIPVFKILSFVPMIIALSNVFGIQILLNLKMDKIFFQITTGGAIIGMILNFFMIRKWGYIGTALNWIVVETYITLAMLVVLRFKGINPIDLKQFTYTAIKNHIQPIFQSIIKRRNSN